MDTHRYNEDRLTGKAKVAITDDGRVQLSETRYNRDSGAPETVHSEPVTLDDLYRRREATQNDLDSLDMLIWDAEQAGARRGDSQDETVE